MSNSWNKDLTPELREFLGDWLLDLTPDLGKFLADLLLMEYI